MSVSTKEPMMYAKQQILSLASGAKGFLLKCYILLVKKSPPSISCLLMPVYALLGF